MQLPAGNEFLLRAQDKGDRFIFLDKKTNKEKASEQIRTSNFLKNILIQLHDIFKSRNNFHKNGQEKAIYQKNGHLS